MSASFSPACAEDYRGVGKQGGGDVRAGSGEVLLGGFAMMPGKKRVRVLRTHAYRHNNTQPIINIANLDADEMTLFAAFPPSALLALALRSEHPNACNLASPRASQQ